ncbi:cytochrome P450 [Pseudonocardia spinosispora]|uniref:cytochrome P450 n=1 Tax=Pseudonocardia spinosispora TaxID=103441 RepID=UPI000402B6F4|nr:cytochrome P450 [Pseudonocardia spinosispora]
MSVRHTLSLYRSRARLMRSAALGDPVARILAMPRGSAGYARYEKVRARGELVRGRSGTYMTVSHRVCNEVLRSDAFGAVPTAASKHVLTPTNGRLDRLVHPLDDSFASVDPPEHPRLRKIVAPFFTPAAMRRLRGFVDEVIDDELDRLDRPERLDLISEFAVRVPSRVICEMLGLPPSDHERFVRWGIEFGATVDGARTPGDLLRTRTLLTEMTEYFEDLCAVRALSPGGADMVSAMVAATEAGEMTRRGLVATCQALLIGGFVTTANIIGNGVVGLMQHPAQRDALLADPTLAATLVEEVLRLEAPAQYSVRIALRPVTVAGHSLERGTPVVTLLAGANRDPEVFPNPNALDLSRPNSRDHLSFAAGIHYCIGAGLARMEGEIALKALFARFPDLRIEGKVAYCPSRVIRGPYVLPIRPR